MSKVPITGRTIETKECEMKLVEELLIPKFKTKMKKWSYFLLFLSAWSGVR